MHSDLNVQVVDLGAITPADLENLWEHEAQLWRERLLWDVSGTCAALRRIVERKGLPGKAIRVDAQTVGYAYYGVVGRLGVISGLVVAPEWQCTEVGDALLHQTVDEIRQQGVSRIESPFVSIDAPWLAPALVREGFRTYWREFLRCELCQARRPVQAPAMVSLEPWRDTHLDEAAAILQAAYDAGVEAEIDEQYRTVDGCRVILDKMLNQGSCGMLVAEASAIARQRGRSIGFVVVTEVAPRQGHLTQVAVLPESQHRGVGRALVDYSLWRLAECRFDTLSLIVSRSNVRARKLYQATGFQSVLAFPVGIWER